MKKFDKSFTQQESVPEEAIERVIEVLRTGRLHRYNNSGGETSEVALLEREFADWQMARYCLATASCGQALQISLRAAGLQAGDKVLANAYTLAPVPGAIFASGGEPVFVEIDEEWHLCLDDLRVKAENSGARYLMLSHMRGHISDMEGIVQVCKEYDITLIEDCAHTMGAMWKGQLSGNFGQVSCFSTQTYKHINSGEGGLLITNDPELAARAVVASGSYMLYDRHGAVPSEETFAKIKLDVPNCSARMDNIRAAILRTQLPMLRHNIHRWNVRYQILEMELRKAESLGVVRREQHEGFVGSSIQFHARGLRDGCIPKFLSACGARGVEVKWFGASEPAGFTSRFDTWRYLGEAQYLPNTLRALATTCDIRIPLTFSEEDCRKVGRIIVEEATRLES